MDMEHEIKKDAPSAQQAAGSIADDPQYKRMLWNVAQDWTRTDRHIALACYIERWADSRAAATPAQPIAPEKLTADLIHLLNTIRPNFGDVGTRDVDVAQQRQRIDRAIIQLGLIVAHDGREHPTPRPGAQPIAVSAPTDAPLSKDALELLNNLHGKASIPTDWPQPFAGTIVLLETLAEIGMTAKRDGQPTANSRLCVRFAADLRDFLVARAAAPVSGPTDA